MKLGKGRRRRILRCYEKSKKSYREATAHKLDWLLMWTRCFGNFEMIFGPETEEWEKERIDLAFAQKEFIERGAH